MQAHHHMIKCTAVYVWGLAKQMVYISEYYETKQMLPMVKKPHILYKNFFPRFFVPDQVEIQEMGSHTRSSIYPMSATGKIYGTAIKSETTLSSHSLEDILPSEVFSL